MKTEAKDRLEIVRNKRENHRKAMFHLDNEDSLLRWLVDIENINIEAINKVRVVEVEDEKFNRTKLMRSMSPDLEEKMANVMLPGIKIAMEALKEALRKELAL